MNKTLKKILISVAASVLTFILAYSGIFARLDYILTDALYQKPVVLNNDIKIIAIDEKSMNELGSYDTWSREYYADLLNILYADPTFAPAVCVFDMIFQGEKDTSSDEAFALAAKNANGVVCAANMVFKDAIKTDENGKKYLDRYNIELIEYPYEALNEYVTVGFADSVQDGKDSVIREFIPVLSKDKLGDETYNEDTDLIPSLSLATARILNEKGLMDINIPKTNPGERLIIKYSGRPGDYEHLSFSDVLNGNIPKEAFKNSIIFIGAYAPGMMDAYNVPTDHDSQMYGVEIHANILESIANGRYMTNTNRMLLSLSYAFIVLLFMLLVQSVTLVISGLTGLFLIIIQIILGIYLSNNHKYLPIIVLPVCILLIYMTMIVVHYLGERMKRHKVLKAFRQYVSPEVVEAIGKKGDYELTLGGRRRDIAVLFVDIRGFTPLSESLEPEQVVEVLNEYLALTTKSIFENYGTLDKFVGDATMGVFNSPFDLDDYVYRAVSAAHDIVAGSENIRKKAFEMTGKNVGFGVGVNCGDAVVGNIGCEFRMDYTAIGDTVNTAARLEANAKAGQVLLSQEVVDRLGDRITVNPVGEIPLKGKSIPLMVYELVSLN